MVCVVVVVVGDHVYTFLGCLHTFAFPTISSTIAAQCWYPCAYAATPTASARTDASWRKQQASWGTHKDNPWLLTESWQP